MASSISTRSLRAPSSANWVSPGALSIADPLTCAYGVSDGPPAIASRNRFGSSPSPSASASDWPTAAVSVVIHALHTSFSAVPWPMVSPAQTTFWEMAAKTGSRRSRSAGSPATRRTRRPVSAGPRVPSIIASTVATPWVAASWATRSAPSSPMVAACTQTASARIAPTACSATESTAAASKRVVITTSASRTASATDVATTAPDATSGCARSMLRFHTVTGKPARRSDRATPAPMIPVPRTAIRGRLGVLGVLGLLSSAMTASFGSTIDLVRILYGSFRYRKSCRPAPAGSAREHPHDRRRQRTERLAAVADGVLLRRGQLGAGPGVAVGHQDQVVAESAAPARLARQRAVELADLDLLEPVRCDKGGGAREVRGAVLGADVAELVEQQAQVRGVVAVTAGPARREDARRATEHVDTQPGIVRDGGQTGVRGESPGLDQRILGERHAVLTRLRRTDVAGPDDVRRVEPGDPAVEDRAQLTELVRVVGREDEPGGHPHTPPWATRVIGPASAAVWIAASSMVPPSARSSSASSSRRSNGAASAVPCTSTNNPRPVTTTFMSVSARTSSTYGRSSIGTPSMIPTLTADTESRSGEVEPLMAPCSRPHATASASATYAPVMAAVRVPPSACRTSQSSTIVFSPRARTSMIERSERPISREISWVRPPMRPLTDSRSLRVFVARGSIAYSEVTQPWPEPLRQRGTPSVNDAAHSTRVPPNSTSTLPSAVSSQPRVIVTGRSSSGRRPSARRIGVLGGVEVMPRTLMCVADSPTLEWRVVAQARRARVPLHSSLGLESDDEAGVGETEGAVIDGASLGERVGRVVPGRDVGEHQHPDAGPGCGRARA